MTSQKTVLYSCVGNWLSSHWTTRTSNSTKKQGLNMSHQSNRSRGERRQTATTLSFTKTRKTSSDSDSDTELASKSLGKERSSSPANDVESPPGKSTTNPAASAAPAVAWDANPEGFIARHRVLTKVRYGGGKLKLNTLLNNTSLYRTAPYFNTL